MPAPREVTPPKSNPQNNSFGNLTAYGLPIVAWEPGERFDAYSANLLKAVEGDYESQRYCSTVNPRWNEDVQNLRDVRERITIAAQTAPDVPDIIDELAELERQRQFIDQRIQEIRAHKSVATDLTARIAQAKGHIQFVVDGWCSGFNPVSEIIRRECKAAGIEL